jgi:hypothetical protein
MTINSKISIFDKYIYVDYSGEYDNQSANDSIDEVVKLCKSKKYTKVLFDFRRITGDVSTFERFKMSEHLISSKPAKIRFACIATEQQTLPVKIGEIFARAAGVDIKITENEASAFKWLDI